VLCQAERRKDAPHAAPQPAVHLLLPAGAAHHETRWTACQRDHCVDAEENMSQMDEKAVVGVLNQILESELAGVVRYTHYSFLLFGFGRIPIVSWLRAQADESLTHAQQAGEWITTLGAYPSLAIGPLLDSHTFDIGSILRESLQAERVALNLYRDLLALVEGRSVAIEEYARQMIHVEELHAGEVDKMLRRPGDVATSKEG
jgi:bacterioferritin